MNENEIIDYYNSEEIQFALDRFLQSVESFFVKNPILEKEKCIHSIKSRKKDASHLRDKLIRKKSCGDTITKDTLLNEVTDLIGVRILHLHLKQFPIIHKEIMRNINELKDWKLVEKPIAYSWDPDNCAFFKKLEIETRINESYYTSVHYVIKPNNERNIAFCEIQVRTLFEEIWGEISHTINYPQETKSLPCKEQLRVLAKLVSTGTRLADAIFQTYEDYNKKK